LRPIARDTGTIGVEQKRPIFTPGVANRVPSAELGVSVRSIARCAATTVVPD
jgi:hypothetical protein